MKNNKRRLRIFILLLALVIGIVGIVAISHADVDFSFSDGHSSHSSDSDDDGELFGLIFDLVFRVLMASPQGRVILLILLVVLIIVYFVSKVSKHGQNQNVRRQVGAGKAADGAAHTIQEKDPNFNEAQFTAYVRSCLSECISSLEKQDEKLVYSFSDDQMYGEWTQKIADLKDGEQQEHFESPTMLSTKILSVHSSDDQDYVTLQTALTAVHYIADKNSTLVSGSRENRDSMNLNTVFVRSRGALTSADHPLSVTHCPCCGAPLTLQNDCCTYCGQAIRTGRHNWVMHSLKIESGLSFTAGDGRSATSLFGDGNRSETTVISEIRENDSEFSADELKEFIRQVYVDLQEAWEARDPSRNKPYVSKEYYQLNTENINRLKASRMINHMDEQQVLSIELRDHYMSKTHEAVVVKLHAQLIDYTVNEDTGKVVSGSRSTVEDRYYRLEFIRALGLKTKPGAAQNIRNCPSCGAPVEVNAVGECKYCGAAITDGQHGWVLNSYSRWG